MVEGQHQSGQPIERRIRPASPDVIHSRPTLPELATERLDNRGLPRYLSVKHAAECLDVSEDFMRRNAGRFGAVRVNPDNPRSPLRFPVELLYLGGGDPTPEPELPRAPRHRRRVPSRADLLPVGDDT